MLPRVLLVGLLACGRLVGAAEADPRLSRGDGIDLGMAAAANERGIVCLADDGKGRVLIGTAGRTAHLLRVEGESVRKLASWSGGVGLAHAIVVLSENELIVGTQADPTGLAAETKAEQVGRLFRVTLKGDKARVDDLGVAVAGQGIHTLAYVPATREVVGNTWPDGHVFVYSLEEKAFRDLGAIAGHRPYETPIYAEKLNFNTNRNVRYTRQVSRAIVVDPQSGAYTAGAGGVLYRYDPATKKLDKTKAKLPAVAGREPWACLDAAVVISGPDEPFSFVGGTSDGFLFRFRLGADGQSELHSWGKASGQPGVQGLVHRTVKESDGGTLHVVEGVAGTPLGVPRAFRVLFGGDRFELSPGAVPLVDGQASLVGFGALLATADGTVYGGERDRIGRLVRFSVETPKAIAKPKPKPTAVVAEKPVVSVTENAPHLPCQIVFAPAGTTSEASGYTALEVGRDGHVYVGAARYGGYAWLLRFPGVERDAKLPLFMDKVAHMRKLSGERRDGINTQGKIHAKILVGEDGRVWFATKQAHEVFGSRPEIGEEPLGFPGGHLCVFDPQTGDARSLGILKHQEGLMAGAIDDARGRLYYRSEPKNHFLVYDIAMGEVQDRGHVGAIGRYMARGAKGEVYFSGRGPTVCRYDPETNYVDDLAVRVEGPGEYAEPYVLLMGPNGRLYGVRAGHPSIMEFDAPTAKNGQIVMRNIAPAAPDGYAVGDIHAAVFGQDGRLYYPLNTAEPGTKGRGKTLLLIMRFDPKTRRTELVGVPEIRGLDEDQVRHVYNRENVYRLDHMQGAAVGADGTLYLLDIYPQLNVACFPGLTWSGG